MENSGIVLATTEVICKHCQLFKLLEQYSTRSQIPLSITNQQNMGCFLWQRVPELSPSVGRSQSFLANQTPFFLHYKNCIAMGQVTRMYVFQQSMSFGVGAMIDPIQCQMMKLMIMNSMMKWWLCGLRGLFHQHPTKPAEETKTTELRLLVKLFLSLHS